MTALELADMQGLIARGYANLKAACYVLLAVDDAPVATAWLASLDVTPGDARPEDTALNVALSMAGLQALGLPSSVAGQFSYEFRTGMATPHRQRMFGDTGANAPEQWLWGGPTTPVVDLVLMLFARTPELLETFAARLADGFGPGGVRQIVRLETTVDLDGREHFGFADGISQPTVDGLSSRVDIPPNTVAAGEFILGYPNEYGDLTDRPLIQPHDDPAQLLARSPDTSGKADLGRNGTYVVIRQLSQQVHAFWSYLDRIAGGDPTRRVWLAAHMVGRWPSGAPLTLAPDADDPLLAGANDFMYQYADEFGLSCPIGAHVRRSHPRDTLDPDPGTARSVALDKRHRLLRRGREYGPPVDDPLAAPPADEPERGLFFICLTGNIARQFEFVQHTWLNNPKFAGLSDEPDPLIGNHADGGTSFSIPAEPVRLRYGDLPTFVTVRGGGYFFLPGLRALRYLASLSRPAGVPAAGSFQPGNISSPVGS